MSIRGQHGTRRTDLPLFHVSKRKVINYLRVERPSRPSQLSQCFGAGTGCGWCRPFLQRLFDAEKNPDLEPNGEGRSGALTEDGLPSADEYKQQRREYVREGKGTPPKGTL